ncbi:tetratricopeptide repeat protein [Desulfobacter postgatei]|uniref:tetratricopeptide repeat protein n=1 Tax=Desulfobacter postgatei TaxID=2293 RepID=UPI00259B06C4|nr:tetratricopeptide repeat protein [uncultured Desulfobacter sp.]
MVKLQAAAKIIQTPQSKKPAQADTRDTGTQADLFSDQELFGVKKGEFIKKSRNRVLADIEELAKNNRWNDILSLYHPVDDKQPDLVRAGADIPVRQKIAFALGQTGAFDDAIKELLVCVRAEPDNFMSRTSLAYTAYNSLYAAKNKKIFLAGEARTQRIALAHEHFKKAQDLRPDGITNFYRQGMLFSQIENKPGPGLEKFDIACFNWEHLTDEKKAERQQEKKNYVKSLYRSASLLLASGNGIKALERITACLKQDEQTHYISLAFKYFALGKVQFCMDHYDEAKSALLFALQSSNRNDSTDFIHELLARTYLAMGKTDKAVETIGGVPEKFRRPYYRWTEADVLCTAGRFEQAKTILTAAAARDSRSRHISLIRLAKIEYTLKNYTQAMEHAAKACDFFTGNWGNPYLEGLFWQSLCAFKAGQPQKADQLLTELERHSRFYPNLDRLRAMIRHSDD